MGVTRSATRAVGLSLTRAALPMWSPRSLFAAGEQGAWYDPSDLSTLYQDAAGTTPVTAVGQPVGLLKDKSGRGNHASQSTTTARPTLQQDSGGRYYLSFDGVDDSLVAANVALGSSDFLACMAAKTTGGSFPSLLSEGSTAAGEWMLRLSSGSPSFYGNAGNPSFALVGALGTTVPFVTSIRRVGTSFDLHASGLVAANVPSSSALGSTKGLMLGGANGESTRYWQGPIYGCVIVVRTVSDASRLSAERYLASKSGVTL